MSGKTHQLRRLVVFPNIYRSLMGEKSSQFTSIPSSSKEIHLRWCFFPNPKSSDFPKNMCISKILLMLWVQRVCCQPNKKSILLAILREKRDLFGMIWCPLMPLSKAATASDFQLRGWKGQLPGLRWQSRDLAAPLGPADQSWVGSMSGVALGEILDMNGWLLKKVRNLYLKKTKPST